MGNIITNTVTKTAGNVTQSVASAVIVFFITTYVLVDFGKKDEEASGADSLKNETIAPSLKNLGGERKNSAGENRTTNGSAEERGVPTNRKEQSASAQIARGGAVQMTGTEPEVMTAPPKNPIEKKLDATVADARAKGDTLAKEKKLNDDVKKVQKRADDVFDELDQEAEKKPPQ